MPRVISEAVQALGVESGKLVCQVNIVNAAGTQVLMSTRSPVGDMPQLDIVSGSITTDDSREIPGSGTCRLIAQDAKIDDIVPRSARHPLSPLARSRIQVYFHAAADPYTNRTAYGMYDIARTELNEDGSGVTIDLEFFDLARRIQRARFPGPWLVLKGTSYEQMVINMLIGVVSEDDIFTVPTARKTRIHHVWEAQDDRLAELKKMETAAGYRFDYNWDGRGQLGYVPDTSETDEPIWDFQEGGNARILSGNRALSDEESYNGVIAIGKAQASDKPPVRGEAWDTNVNSLTYYDPANPDASTYGPVPFFYVSEMLTTSAQCRLAARTRLPKVSGMSERVSLDAVANPGVATSDPCRLIRPNIGIQGTYVIEAVKMPMVSADGRMQVTCRERKVFA